MADIIERPLAHFSRAAAPQATMALHIDSDIAAYFQSQNPTKWQAEANEMLRFFLDTSQRREHEFGGDALEQGEMIPAPSHNF